MPAWLLTTLTHHGDPAAQAQQGQRGRLGNRIRRRRQIGAGGIEPAVLDIAAQHQRGVDAPIAQGEVVLFMVSPEKLQAASVGSPVAG